MKKPANYRPPLTSDSIRTDQLIVEAVHAERERAAKIAETFWNHGGPSFLLVQKIAAAIRSPLP